jgi:mono/diheme cytochrome c family protein
MYHHRHPKLSSFALWVGLVFIILSLGISSLLSAQREQPADSTEEALGETAEAGLATTTTMDPANCQGDLLIDAKAEIDAMLADFETQASTDTDSALASLFTAGEAYNRLALDCGYLPENLDGLVIHSTDVERVLTALETLNGDPLRGQLLYNGREPSANGSSLGCSGCHEQGVAAPKTEGTWTRWDEQYSLEPRFADYTFEEYAVESIILPWEYTVEPFPEMSMPNIYHDQLSYQDLADIVEYLNSQDQLLEE